MGGDERGPDARPPVQVGSAVSIVVPLFAGSIPSSSVAMPCQANCGGPRSGPARPRPRCRPGTVSFSARSDHGRAPTVIGGLALIPGSHSGPGRRARVIPRPTPGGGWTRGWLLAASTSHLGGLDRTPAGVTMSGMRSPPADCWKRGRGHLAERVPRDAVPAHRRPDGNLMRLVVARPGGPARPRRRRKVMNNIDEAAAQALP